MQERTLADGNSVLRSIQADSRKRRAEPYSFFRTFLRDIWQDNTKEEAYAQWRTKVEQAPWYADDALYCINAVLDNPPEDLVEMMFQDGWIALYHESSDPEVEEPYTLEEYVDWLTTMRNDFQTIYDTYPSKHT